MEPQVMIADITLLSDNWYKLRKYEYTLTYGKEPPRKQMREVYDRGNGATILLYNKVSGKIILTRQFRLPTFVNGNRSGMMIEACAGLLDEDSPEDCIRRETEEETGYRVHEVKKIFEAYMSPGSVTEILHFYVGAYEQEMKLHEGGGLEAEQENIEVMELDFTVAVNMIEQGDIRDAKTIMLIQYLRINQIINC